MPDKRIALVTGANQGIGLQIATDLVAHGFAVLVGSRNPARGQSAAKEVGPNAYALQLDVTDQASITTAAEYVRNEFGRLDVLVQNAARTARQARSRVGKTERSRGEASRACWPAAPVGERITCDSPYPEFNDLAPHWPISRDQWTPYGATFSLDLRISCDFPAPDLFGREGTHPSLKECG
jgi:NAD(P)-dependent dehydrogenase (short-subunit alcohol dehydrogenase family)